MIGLAVKSRGQHRRNINSFCPPTETHTTCVVAELTTRIDHPWHFCVPPLQF